MATRRGLRSPMALSPDREEGMLSELLTLNLQRSEITLNTLITLIDDEISHTYLKLLITDPFFETFSQNYNRIIYSS